jgi:hypothetical protein
VREEKEQGGRMGRSLYMNCLSSSADQGGSPARGSTTGPPDRGVFDMLGQDVGALARTMALMAGPSGLECDDTEKGEEG